MSSSSSSSSSVATWSSAAYFNEDRLRKYLMGSFRLAVIVYVALYHLSPLTNINITTFGSANAAVRSDPENFVSAYAQSWRWLGHVYIGSIGALVNVQLCPLPVNLCLLAVAGAFIARDVCIYADPAMCVYAIKTFGGDYLAGKLDTLEWKLVLFFVVVACPLLIAYVSSSGNEYVATYGPITVYLLLIQVICECGDNYLESWKFFRYRYSYEVFNVLLFFSGTLKPYEQHIVLYDMVICLFYRISNTVIILIACADNGELLRLMKKYLFLFAGWWLGVNVVCVENPITAVSVMKCSVNKGFFLERHIALPAWDPILSLESVDGVLWRRLKDRFNKLLAVLPSVTELQVRVLVYTDSFFLISCTTGDNDTTVPGSGCCG
jgi:hypothetical protein